MSDSTDTDLYATIHEFVTARMLGQLTPEQLERMEQLLRANPEARRMYVRYIEAMLAYRAILGSSREVKEAHAAASSAVPPPAARSRSSVLGFLHRALRIDGESPLATALTWMVMAILLIGTTLTAVFIGMMVFGVKPPAGQQVVAKDADKPKSSSVNRPSTNPNVPVPDGSPVARLVRMVDCRWESAAAAPKTGDDIVTGRKLALKSGLAEIIFQGGARTLLEGPATLEIRSRMGVYLQQGKFTVTVENPLARGFEVRAPGMKYTDLGTEFGVFVAANGEQEVQVFRGNVRAEEETSESSGTGDVEPAPAPQGVQSATGSDGSHPPSPSSHKPPAVLSANQGLHVAAPDPAGKKPKQVERVAANDKKFIRAITVPLDLADIVAGGDGTTGKTGRGLDALTGNATETKVGPNVAGTRDFRKVTAVKFVDGVFVPNGENGPVQLDSAGHSYALPKTCGRTDHAIFAETAPALASKPESVPQVRTPLADSVADALTRQHSRLYLHANVGITFDLDAIRADQPRHKPTRFQAMLCTERSDQSEAPMSAWVFVDGKLCFEKQSFRLRDGNFGIDVSLPAGARFLTLVATDADQTIVSDHVIFHCPQVVMEVTEP
jgi:hypothetical protein